MVSNMKYKYWCSSPDNKIEKLDKGFYIEYNPKLKMWRLGGRRVPMSAMGYNPHWSVVRRDYERLSK